MELQHRRCDPDDSPGQAQRRPGLAMKKDPQTSPNGATGIGVGIRSSRWGCMGFYFDSLPRPLAWAIDRSHLRCCTLSRVPTRQSPRVSVVPERPWDEVAGGRWPLSLLAG